MPYILPRCQIVPLAEAQFAFVIDGVERLRWHAAPTDHPRPYFHPLIGPSGAALTRLGHPGAPDHDHHRGIWFAHHHVTGIDFWANHKPPRIRQLSWLLQQESDAAAIFGAELAWYDGHDPGELLRQQMLCGVSPGENAGEIMVEIQTTLTPKSESLELGQTNFGLLAIRVARHLSGFFGGGKIINSEGVTGEPAIFGKPARWVDYSGPAFPSGKREATGEEGLTYFDHPTNPNHPAKWHVREDGWLGASLTRDVGLVLQRDKPLLLRYLIASHVGVYEHARAEKVFAAFSKLPGWELVKNPAKHTNWGVRRLA
jgi:hypothetical protein